MKTMTSRKNMTNRENTTNAKYTAEALSVKIHRKHEQLFK